MDRFFDLLPLMSRESIIDGGDGNTPCFHARELGRAIGLDKVYIKDETKQPTLTTKDRMGALVVAVFRELGIRQFVTSSTGNSCTSLARIVSRYPDDIRMSIFVGDEFLQRLNWPNEPNITVYWLKNGTFVDAHEAARWFSQNHPEWVSERGFFSFAKRESLKTAYLEAVEQIPEPIEYYFQGISSAMGLYSTFGAAQQLLGLGRIARLPAMVGVQEETCNPMVRAWERGAERMEEQDIIRRPHGLSKSTLRGDSRMVYPYVRRAMVESGGFAVTATQEEMREARELVRQTEGLDICYTSAMTVAAARKLAQAGRLRRDAVIMLNITGADRVGQPSPMPHYIVERDGSGWTVTPADPVRDVGVMERVRQVLVEQNRLPTDTRIDSETRLVDGGLALDSVGLLEFSLALEREFGCHISENELTPQHFATVGTVADLMRSKITREPAGAPN
ncbi:MAG: pyridoxal-phosphate dependent enzyme [Candidatus Sumerlaeaceae bacterium]|nr:pyridoxal-phosphate dependent enzyme [Candidatus Sumerlaeaceae bacterium]